MKSNLKHKKGNTYYIGIKRTINLYEEEPKTMFLALDRNDNYCLCSSNLNSRCISFDDISFAEKWLNYNYSSFSFLLSVKEKFEIISA